ncbi:MAG: hypothetical protein AAFU03_13940, partial [Bacteroidota bacterium]
MKGKSLITLIMLMVIVVGCSKNYQGVSVRYQISDCCNFYDEEEYDCGFFGSGNSMEERVLCALRAESVVVLDLNVIDLGIRVECVICCKCPSGRELSMVVREEDVEKVLALG